MRLYFQTSIGGLPVSSINCDRPLRSGISLRPMTYETFVADFCRSTLSCNKSLHLQPCQMQLQQNAQQTCRQVTDDDVLICGMPLPDAIIKKTEKKRAKTLKKCLHT